MYAGILRGGCMNFNNSDMEAYRSDAAGVLDSAIETLTLVTQCIEIFSKEACLEDFSDGICNVLMDIGLKLERVRGRIS
jgi:hypothetical protein